MSQIQYLIGTLLALSMGCSKAPARFETSDAPPPEAKDDVPLRPQHVPIQAPADSRYQFEVTTGRFLLALQNRASEQLEALLAPDATVREQGAGSGNPALPTLLDLASTWSGGPSERAPSSSSATLPFGRAHIVALETQGKDAWATVEVDGPPKLRGLWKVRLGEGYGASQVQEVILPKGN